MANEHIGGNLSAGIGIAIFIALVSACQKEPPVGAPTSTAATLAAAATDRTGDPIADYGRRMIEEGRRTYDELLKLGLSNAQKRDLVEYLKGI